MKKSIIFSLVIFSTLLSYGQLSLGISTGPNISSMSVSLRDLSTPLQAESNLTCPTQRYKIENMSKVIFDSGISLDGFFAGDNRGPNNPMGGVSHNILAKEHSTCFHSIV